MLDTPSRHRYSGLVTAGSLALGPLLFLTAVRPGAACPWMDTCKEMHAAGMVLAVGSDRSNGLWLLLQHARPVNPTGIMVSGCQRTRDDRSVQRASRGIYLDS